MLNGSAVVVANISYAPFCYKITLRVPSTEPIAAGQFAHIQIDSSSILLRRPFSYWDARPAGRGKTDVDLLYTVVGTGTELLARQRRGKRLGYLGPLGIGFAPPHDDVERLLFVAGGVGIVPFYLFTKQLRASEIDLPIQLLFGARTSGMLWGIDDFTPLNIEVNPITEDGSRGFRGRVTDLLEETLARVKGRRVALYACGPEPMLDRVALIARRKKIRCEVSLEKRMGCALGACGACVTKVYTDDRRDWRYSRICIEGPTYAVDRLYLEPA